jgi:hypothetical protein
MIQGNDIITIHIKIDIYTKNDLIFPEYTSSIPVPARIDVIKDKTCPVLNGNELY